MVCVAWILALYIFYFFHHLRVTSYYRGYLDTLWKLTDRAENINFKPYKKRHLQSLFSLIIWKIVHFCLFLWCLDKLNLCKMDNVCVCVCLCVWKRINISVSVKTHLLFAICKDALLSCKYVPTCFANISVIHKIWSLIMLFKRWLL